jgi:capsid assembly protease
MRLFEMMTGPWAITPTMLQEIQQVYATHLKGDKIDIKGIEAKLGKPLVNEPKTYEVIDGVAVVPVEGVIAPKMNMFTQISGGVSTQLLGQDLTKAINDPSVHSIVLAIDSPGGAVSGTPELADQIFQQATQKPMVAFANGMMASAAYWLGAAAGRIVINGKTTQVGSIGVVATHYDYSQANRAAGVTVTDITSGKYKRIASENAPLSQEGRQSIQDQTDHIYSMFVEDVARYRGVSVEQVLSDMADGRVFTGTQAIAAGLVDGVSTLDALIAELSAKASLKGSARMGLRGTAVVTGSITPNSSASAASLITPPKGTKMDKATLDRDHADLAASLRAEGAAAETQRVKDVRAQSLPGHDALINTLAADGKTTGAEAAQAIIAAERISKTANLNALRAEAPKPVNAVAPPAEPVAAAEETPQAKRQRQADEAKAYATKHGVSVLAAAQTLGLDKE